MVALVYANSRNSYNLKGFALPPTWYSFGIVFVNLGLSIGSPKIMMVPLGLFGCLYADRYINHPKTRSGEQFMNVWVVEAKLDSVSNKSVMTKKSVCHPKIFIDRHQTIILHDSLTIRLEKT